MQLIEFVNLSIGVPFDEYGSDFSGWNCWNMIVMAYQKVYGIMLPKFDNISALNSEEAEELFDYYKKQWKEVSKGRTGDVVLMRHGSWACHTGMVIKPGEMLHVDMDIETCVQNYTTGLWKKKVVGIYRHAELT